MASSPTGGQAAGVTLVVTISSTYGAGGSVVGPEVARRLHLPFVGSAVAPSAISILACSADA